MNRIIILSLFTIIISQGCASFNNKFETKTNLTASDTNSINGKYHIDPIVIDSTSKLFNVAKLDLNLVDELLQTSLYSGYPKSEKHANQTLELQLENTSLLKVKILENDKIIREKSLKVKMEKDGFLYLDKQRESWGIPYLFGSFEVNRRRITLDHERNLILEASNFRGGALLLIMFLDFGSTKYNKKFERIN